MITIVRNSPMLDLLLRAEAELPMFISDTEGWQSLDVDYEPPRVERLWRWFQGHRLYLHRIHPCAEALYHPHPWPSAVKVVSGSYEMGVGIGADAEPPPLASTLVLEAGSLYEMAHPNGWHYVRPREAPSLSIMVTARPWPDKHPGLKGPKDGVELKPLSDTAKYDLIEAFRAVYPLPFSFS